MKVCKNCGEINSNDVQFCPNCGGKAFVFQEERTCPHCGAANDKSFVYCISCGQKLFSEAVSVEEVAPSAQILPGEEGFVPTPVDVRELHSDVYAGGAPSIPHETARCPVCGANVPIHAIFCQKCGTPVANLHEHRVVNRKVCPHCGRSNGLDAHFCSYCFCSLAEAETEEMQIGHELRSVGGDQVKQTYLEDVRGKKKICTNCGALNEYDEMFCVNCGFKLDVEQQKKYCPNCGAENAADSAFCTSCQWSFNGDEPSAEEKWVCAKCGNVNKQNNEYCVACGSKRDATGR